MPANNHSESQLKCFKERDQKRPFFENLQINQNLHENWKMAKLVIKSSLQLFDSSTYKNQNLVHKSDCYISILLYKKFLQKLTFSCWPKFYYIVNPNKNFHFSVSQYLHYFSLNCLIRLVKELEDELNTSRNAAVRSKLLTKGDQKRLKVWYF